MSNIIAAAGLAAAAGAASGVGLVRLLDVQRSKVESKHHKDVLNSINVEHRKEKKAESVLESIETWCNTHKEILKLKDTILVAEAEHAMFLLAAWVAGPRCCVHAKEADRAKIGQMKKRVMDLKRMNDIGNGAWLIQINNDIINWQITRKNARKAKCRAMQLSAMQGPKSWHCCAPMEHYKQY